MELYRNLKILNTIFVVIVMLVALLAYVLLATALEIPKDATPFGSPIPLPCDGYVILLDTNGNQEDGAEIAAVWASGEPSPRAILYFGEGAEGEFKYALVKLPKMPEVRFNTRESFASAYQGPCAIVAAEGTL